MAGFCQAQMKNEKSYYLFFWEGVAYDRVGGRRIKVARALALRDDVEGVAGEGQTIFCVRTI